MNAENPVQIDLFGVSVTRTKVTMRRTFLMIRQHPDEFRQPGMRVWLPPFT